jgi:hypothetical protein
MLDLLGINPDEVKKAVAVVEGLDERIRGIESYLAQVNSWAKELMEGQRRIEAVLSAVHQIRPGPPPAECSRASHR